jgi:Leucine-rich repeat (LRR) protein
MIKNNNWTDELISWAIEHHIPEPNSDELLKEGLNPLAHFISHGGGFPRDKYDLENNMFVLRLDDCNITSLPKDIGHLINLKKIDLRDNKLTELPSEICSLENLEILDISNNGIKQLPDEIVNIKKLRLFIFNGNENLKLTHQQEEWIKQFKSENKYG